MTIKINKLEIENVKRVKAVKIEPTANGLTIVGAKTTRVRRPYWIASPGHWGVIALSRVKPPGKGP